MNRQIQLTESEIELLNKILAEFRGREGIGLEPALCILYYKINGFVGFKECLDKFHKLRYKNYRDLFRRTDEKVLKDAELLIRRVNMQFRSTNLKGIKDED